MNSGKSKQLRNQWNQVSPRKSACSAGPFKTSYWHLQLYGNALTNCQSIEFSQLLFKKHQLIRENSRNYSHSGGDHSMDPCLVFPARPRHRECAYSMSSRAPKSTLYKYTDSSYKSYFVFRDTIAFAGACLLSRHAYASPSHNDNNSIMHNINNDNNSRIIMLLMIIIA